MDEHKVRSVDIAEVRAERQREPWTEEMLRWIKSDYAGELGAVYIYEGALRALCLKRMLYQAKITRSYDLERYKGKYIGFVG